MSHNSQGDGNEHLLTPDWEPVAGQTVQIPARVQLGELVTFPGCTYRSRGEGVLTGVEVREYLQE